MKKDSLKIILILVSIILLDTENLSAQIETATNDWKLTTAGSVRQLVINRNRMYKWSGDKTTDYPGLVNCEYPAGSGIEHVSRFLLYIGGMLPDETFHITGPNEAWPSSAPWDTIWVVSQGDTIDIGGSDEEGNSDIYWPGYTAVSDQDLVCRYSDYKIQPNNANHVPMNLDIIQTVNNWSSGPLKDVILWTYYLIPVRQDIFGLYLTVSNQSKVGNIQVMVNAMGSSDDRVSYLKDLNMCLFEDGPEGIDGTAPGPMGLMLIPGSDWKNTELYPSFQWSPDFFGVFGDNDAETYELMMSSNVINQDQENFGGNATFLSLGPFDVTLGDTLVVHMAQILGNGLEAVMQTAETVDRLKDNNFKVPTSPPVPDLQVITDNKKARLTWEPTENSDPENYTDQNRLDDVPQPFEGYRLYKSTYSIEGPWILLAEYDITGNDYANNIGIQHEYIDEGLLNNIEYYYSITAFSKEDRKLNWPSLESGIRAGAKQVVPGTAPPESVGEVAVVPNPYRGDIAYRNYNPPWEKAPVGRPWMEQDRRVQFINLPERCVIKVYTLTGDFIWEKEHESANRGYEDWNLTSSIDQAIASGLYIFTVEDLDNGKVQVGRFVVIK